MRLRRETGDFSIVFTSTTNPIITKNLLAEDLLGCVIEAADGTLSAVISVSVGTGKYTLSDGTNTYEYTLETGVVKKSA